jgi:hypothetical protein
LAEEELRRGKVSDDPLKEGIDLASWLEFAARRVPEVHAGALAKRRDLTLEATRQIEVQRPSLLARQRPGARPLQLAAYSVDIDPLSFTLTGGKETDPAKIAALPVAPAQFRFSVQPGSPTGSFRPVTLSWSGKELETAGVIEDERRAGAVTFTRFGAKTVTRQESGSHEAVLSDRESPILLTSAGGELHLWPSPTRKAAPVRMALPMDAVFFTASGSRIAYCTPAKPPAEGYKLWAVTFPAATPQLFASSASGKCGPLEFVGAGPRAGIANRNVDSLRLHKMGTAAKLLATVDRESLISITTSAFDASGQVLAYATNNGIALLSVNGSQPERHPTIANKGLIAEMRFSPDGRWLASGDTEGGVSLLGLGGRELVPVRLPPGSGGVQKLAFSDDSKLLAAFLADGRVQVYSITRASVLVRLTKLPNPSSAWLAETPDGRFDAPPESWTIIQREDAGGSLVTLQGPSPQGYTPGLFEASIAGN